MPLLDGSAREARKHNFAISQTAQNRFKTNSAIADGNRAAARVAIRPGAPLPTGRPSMRTTGMTIWLAEVMKASRAA